MPFMLFSRNTGIRLLLVLLCGVLAAGCPRRDVGVKLLVSPEELNYGTSQSALTLSVSKNVTSTPSGPIVVTSGAAWILPEICLDASENCMSRGPLDDVAIPVRVDRTQTRLGINTGLITVQASNASVETVLVRVEDVLEANFTANARAVNAGSAVTFTDNSATSEAGGPIVGRRWAFGDGNTSTATNPSHTYTTPGIYNVSLTITTATTEETLVREGYITVVGVGPTVDFQASATTIEAGKGVTFTDLSTSSLGPITEWFWEFGDGGTSRAQNPTYTYERPGAYSVSLSASTQFGTAILTKPNYITVQANLPGVAEFTLDPLRPQMEVPVQFIDLSNPGSGTITGWAWDFGDGNGSEEQDPVHTYAAVGEYEVTLTIVTALGQSTRTRTVVVENRPPSAEFAANKTNPSTLESLQFTDLSEPGSRPIVSWVWSFGDGGTSNERNPAYAYRAAGTYTVSLTITTGADTNNTSTERKVDYITVVDAPAVGFTMAPLSAFVGDTITFTNTSTPGGEPQVNYAWNFGDPDGEGNTSTSEDATHVFAAPGTYEIELTATTPTRSVSRTQTLTVDAPPVPDFTGAPLAVITGEPVQFTDQTEVEDRRPVESRVWNFGDGQQSNQVSPAHAYTAPGEYTVSLTVNYSHSATEETFSDVVTRTDYVEVTEPVLPTAAFSIDTLCVLTDDEVTFTDASTAGSRPITRWDWQFGDGGLSNEPSPTHVYSNPGTYTVRLTVTSDALPAGANSDTHEMEVSVAESGPLDAYVRMEDPNYDFNSVNSFPINLGGGLPSVQVDVLRMVSQQWRTSADVVDGLLWSHNVAIVVPENVSNSTALLYINGGSRTSATPTAGNLPSFLAPLAVASGSVVVMVDNIPSQPITFLEEEGIRSRSEDELIAYSYAKFLESVAAGSPDTSWPALFGMVKAAVRTMDTVQTHLGAATPVNDFIVTGVSKRGWTTWLTAAADCRVSSIVPMVIDVLNIDEQMEHHRNAYGYWAPAIYDYAQMKVLDKLLDASGNTTVEGQALLDLVDPFEYRDRLDIPKYILNASGDQFFLPDSSRFYAGQLDGETHLNYVPNANHSLINTPGDERNTTDRLLAWMLSETQDIERPSIDWVFESDSRMVVTPSTTPATVRLWQAANPSGRDFRLEQIGAAWTSTTLTAQPDGTFVGEVTPPADGWLAFFVEVRFANTAELQAEISGAGVPPFVYTTDVGIVPDVYPLFVPTREDVGPGDAPVTVLRLFGSPFTMGFEYGQLMRAEINAFIPNYLAIAQSENPTQLSNANLDAAWAQLSPKMDPRLVDEINGIANGALLDVTILRRAHMVPVVETGVYSGFALSVWGETTTNGRVLSAETLNWPLSRGAQNFPVVVVYTPPQGFPHATATFAGFAFGPVGMNLSGVSTLQAEVGAGTNNFGGNNQHYLPLSRELLYEAASLGQVMDFLEVTPAIHNDRYVFGDGRFEFRGVKAVMNPGAQFIFQNDTSNDEFRPRVRDGLVYAGPQPGTAVFNYVTNNLGSLNDNPVGTPGSLLSLMQSLGTTNNVLNVVMDNEALEMHVNYGLGTAPAHQRGYVTIDVQAQIPPGPPVGR